MLPLRQKDIVNDSLVSESARVPDASCAAHDKVLLTTSVQTNLCQMTYKDKKMFLPNWKLVHLESSPHTKLTYCFKNRN